MHMTPPSRVQQDTLSKKGIVILTTMMPLVLITRLLTRQADIPLAPKVKIPLNIKHHKLNMITYRNSIYECNNKRYDRLNDKN